MSKSSWPEVVDLGWKEASETIKRDFPNICIQVVPEDSMVTMDYRVDRVRIFTKKDGTVARIPTIG